MAEPGHQLAQVAPDTAASVAPVCRRSWNLRSGRAAACRGPGRTRGTASRAPGGRRTRPGTPERLRGAATWSRRCAFTAGIRCGGMATSRLPASDFGPLDDTAAHGAGDAAADADDLVPDVDIGAAQLGQLAEPQRAPGGHQDHQLVAAGNLGRYRLQLGQGRGADCLGAFGLPGPAYAAGVRCDHVIGHRGRQDGAQQAVGMSLRGRPGSPGPRARPAPTPA